MNKISMKAVLVGGCTDLVVTNLLSIPFVVFVIVSAGLTELPKDQIQTAIIVTIRNNGALHAIQLILGLVATAIGGYTAARIAKRDTVLHGALASWSCVVLGTLSIAAGNKSTSVTATIALILASIAVAALGGLLREPARVRVRIPV